MSLDREYASFLIAASNIYAAQGSARCSQAESEFEGELFKLFSQASRNGMALQDIVVITSTAIAVMLTKGETAPPARIEPAASESPPEPVESNVISMRSSLARRSR
jgi:hypothetical protein